MMTRTANPWYNTDMTNHKLIRRLHTLKKSVLEDGKVDWKETEQLLAAIGPLAEKHEFLFEDYQRILKKCREDGKISPDESKLLAAQLEIVCGQITKRRLSFWLVAAAITLLAVASCALLREIAASTRSSTVSEPESEAFPEGI